MPSIEDLPFEILSEILTIAAELNARDTPSYTYGLTQAEKTLQRVQTQIFVRGRTTPDVFRWDLVDSIRPVNSRWHDWALSYAMKEIYVCRWRGGERWLYKGSGEQIRSSASAGVLPVVYQYPYTIVDSTVRLFRDYPNIAKHVRRIWFNGIYQFETNESVFEILRKCTNLRAAAIPWTALRYGTAADWRHITLFPQLTSVEFLATSFKTSEMQSEVSRTDNKPLRTKLNFSGLTRLKVSGDSNLMPISDADLIGISRTATNLEEVHVSGCGSVTVVGIAALIRASWRTLKLLEFKPAASADIQPSSHVHLCTLIASCPRLVDLAVTMPSCCAEIFTPAAAWKETARIRISNVCHPHLQLHPTPDIDDLVTLLDAARDKNVEFEIADFLFDVKNRRVHGDFRKAKKLSEGTWRPREEASARGPYGDGEGWSAVSEEGFWDGLRWGLVRLDSGEV